MSCSVVILAAGQGKRMNVPTPKVMLGLGGSSLLQRIIRSVLKAKEMGAEIDKIYILLSHEKERIEKHLRESFDLSSLNIECIDQGTPRGTGHALQVFCEKKQDISSVLVLPGDMPLVPPQLILEMSKPLKSRSCLRILTTEIDRPSGYGRVVRDRSKNIRRIVEEKDADPAEKMIREISVSVYLFKGKFIKDNIFKLKASNAQREFYLTDLIEIASSTKKELETVFWNESLDLRGVNNLDELAQAEAYLIRKLIREASMQGVRFTLPETTYLEDTVTLEPEVEIAASVVLKGKTHLSRGAVIGSNVTIEDSFIGPKSVIKSNSVIVQSKIGEKTNVGPSAHLRPESEVGNECKIGNFVELKKTKIGNQTNVAHLSYLGDAIVGSKVNIGCGFITCNYDGRVINGSRKHRTTIEDEAFVGSDVQAVAPITIGKGAYVASGSTLTKNVEPGSLAIARSRQENKPGFAKKLKGTGN